MENNNQLRRELALSIAELIVNETMTWELARQRIRENLSYRDRQCMPTSEEIESAVRETWAIFAPESHRRLLNQKRKLALSVLSLFSDFNAYLTGAVLNGCAGPDTNIRIEVFCDDVKAVEITLMENGIDFEAISPENSAMPLPLEALGFLIKNPNSHQYEGVRIEIFSQKHIGLNPYKRKPDPWQKPWESEGKIQKEALFSAISH